MIVSNESTDSGNYSRVLYQMQESIALFFILLLLLTGCSLTEPTCNSTLPKGTPCHQSW